jgi:hypothetical protein
MAFGQCPSSLKLEATSDESSVDAQDPAAAANHEPEPQAAAPRQAGPAAEGGGDGDQEDRCGGCSPPLTEWISRPKSGTSSPLPLHRTVHACHLHVVVLVVDMVYSAHVPEHPPSAGACLRGT